MLRRVLRAMTGWAAMSVVASWSVVGRGKRPRPPPADRRAAGAALFAARCADCHGADATGVRGPDLTRLWGAGATDDRVFQAIRQGVPGSIMPAYHRPRRMRCGRSWPT